MMTLAQTGGVALITGASAGIGESFARRLAIGGFDLVISARREDRLKRLADELQRAHQVDVEVIRADLSSQQGVELLAHRIVGEPRLVLLVNNAGFGVSGSYVEQPVEKHQRMIDVHVTATVRLTHAALPGMIGRGAGYIVNVSSIAAYVPVGGGPGYSASKAYLNAFSTNLQGLVADKGVRIQALCPGYTYTEFHGTEDYQGNEREVIPRWAWMTADEVVDYSLGKLDSGRVIVIPGFKNRLVVFFLKSRIGGKLMSLRSLVFPKR